MKRPQTLEEIDRVLLERATWDKSVPALAVYYDGSQNLGRCYNAYWFRIESRIKLSPEMIADLRKAGVLGFGQEFRLLSGKEGTERKATFTPSGTNPRDDKPYQECAITLYCYRFEDRVDSSD